jgi:hypothetical protein
MSRFKRPGLEALEDRNLMSTVSLLNGVLTLQGDANAANVGAVTQSTSGGVTTTHVSLDGQSTSYTAAVNKIVFQGGAVGDYFTNATGVNASVTSGNGNNNIHAGSGTDTISLGSGANVVYDAKGTANITLAAHSASTVDRLVLTSSSTVTGAQSTDMVVKGAAPGQGPSSPVVLRNGTLYLTANNASYNNFYVYQSGSTVNVMYDMGTGYQFASFNASDVHFLAGYGGSGSDSFVNATSIGDAFVAGSGSASAMLYGGRGFNLLDGGTGGMVHANGTYNDLTGSSAMLIGNLGSTVLNVFHNTNGQDAILHANPQDIVTA